GIASRFVEKCGGTLEDDCFPQRFCRIPADSCVRIRGFTISSGTSRPFLSESRFFPWLLNRSLRASLFGRSMNRYASSFPSFAKAKDLLSASPHDQGIWRAGMGKVG